MWFRVVTNKDGGIASCDAVEGQEHDGKGIFYVDAQTPAAACLAAKQMWLERYEKRKESTNKCSRDLKQRRKKAGLCACGQTPRPGLLTCALCAATAARTKARIAAGDVTSKKPLSPAEKINQEKRTLALRREQAKRQAGGLSGSGMTKLYLLRRTLAAFRVMTGPQFEGHLVAQIAGLEAKRQQKPEPKAQAAE